jgi:CRISPR-associated protein, csn1 family
MERKYGIGLDIGIGSVGYAVISRTNNLDARIEDIGVRLFDSGENIRQKASNAQERRGYRSTRRLLRRRKHRKERIKKFFLKIKLMNEMQLKAWQEQNGNQNVLQTRIKGLNEKLTPEEILDCIIHICNRRGYREFYGDDSKKDNADKDELQKIEGGLANFDEIYQSGGYKSVAEMLINAPVFKTETSFADYRNHKNAKRYILIKREFVKKELEDILNKQSEYYPQLTANNIRIICDDMVFAQRDFETGPGNEDDKTRRFMGFIDSIGQCMYYKDEKRAYRSTVIADIYALVNCLSQLSFVNTETGEILLPENVAKEIINTSLTNASITENDIKNILKQNKLEMRKPGKLEVTVPDTIRTLKTLKAVLTNAGYKYEELIKENQFDINNPSKLHQLCLLLSENITPARRIRALKAKGWNEKLQKEVIRKKFGGTASVCEKYMVEAIEAFKRGETYGNFQARMLKEREDALPDIEKQKYLAPFDKKVDEELVKNTVVFKAVNETRKILNELIRKYGSPEYINIEVADDLGRSFKERAKIIKRINDNKKEKDKIANKLIELGLRKEGEVKPFDIERYRLWEEQEGKDLYTGEVIPVEKILSGIYDVDHIVPFSLILDDTLQNKALVNLGVNRQQKGQQVPLGYLSSADKEDYLKRVNTLFKKKKISIKKYKYLTLSNLYGNRDLLSEWKSRNINDTRYITRFLVNYLSANLLFSSGKAKNVFGVKGIITSRMRRLWLNKKTWGDEQKNRDNNLHHAADAIVIANLTPAYLEIASDKIKLDRIYKDYHKRISDEYLTYLGKAVNKMVKYYGFNREYTEKLLATPYSRVPAMIRNIADEVDIRLWDNSLEFYKDVSEEQFYKNVKAFYKDDAVFADSIKPVLVSYKQNKKYQGKFTKDNPLKKNETDGAYIKKVDSFGNANVLDTKEYYCAELYKNNKNQTILRGIRYVDLKKKNKKLYLITPYPEDYQEHIMYLFANDYIKIFDNIGNIKFSGYYRGIKNSKANRIYCKNNNCNLMEDKTIGKKDVVKKYYVDILGKIGGEIKCSVPFLSQKDNI